MTKKVRASASVHMLKGAQEMIPLGKEIICVILVFILTTQMSYGEGIWDFLNKRGKFRWRGVYHSRH